MSKKPPPKDEDEDETLHEPDEEGDVFFGIGPWVQPVIEPGEYIADFVRHEIGESFGRKCLYLHFQILNHPEAKFVNIVLFMACAYPKERGAKFGRHSKLYRAARIALGDDIPNRRTEAGITMSLKIFKGKRFKVAVRTVMTDGERSPEHPNGRPKHPNEFYSVVDHIVALVGPTPAPERESEEEKQ